MTGRESSANPCTCSTPQWRYAGKARTGRPDCERPELVVCIACSGSFVKRCSRSSRVACLPCSETYRRRVRRVFLSGYSDNPLRRVYMLTLTAPGSGRHRRPDGTWCRCTPEGGVNPAEWNGTAGMRFNRFMQDLRRRLGDVQYAKAAEVQRRHLLHFHVLIRLPLAGIIGGAPGAWPGPDRDRLLTGPGPQGTVSALCPAGSRSS